MSDTKSNKSIQEDRIIMLCGDSNFYKDTMKIREVYEKRRVLAKQFSQSTDEMEKAKIYEEISLIEKNIKIALGLISEE
jgi:hypothetical protein